jgi:hypothetical protein
MRRLCFGLLCLAACGGDDASSPVGDAGLREAEAGPGNTITVHTTAPVTAVSLAGPANATWAAYLGPGGVWAALAPASVGTYNVPVSGDRWVAAFICSDTDQNAYVDIYDRAASVTDMKVVLEKPCRLDTAPTIDLSGTFSHAVTTTGWFDFGYVPDDRGSVLPFDNGTAAYELVNVLQGNWDLVFGFRDDSNAALTKMFFARALAMAGDTLTLDADLGVKGFIPTQHALKVTGVAADDSLRAPVLYTVGGGEHGVDMGPQIIAGPNLTYSVIPDAQQTADDRYRGAIQAEGPMQLSSRGGNAVFHNAIDLTIDLPVVLPDPVVTTVTATPYLRISGKVTARAAAATYELLGFTRITDQVSKVWLYSTDAQPADGTTLEIILPDLSAVAGWQPSWALTTADTKITLTAREKPTPLSDGTLERFASKSVILPP